MPPAAECFFFVAEENPDEKLDRDPTLTQGTDTLYDSVLLHSSSFV